MGETEAEVKRLGEILTPDTGGDAPSGCISSSGRLRTGFRLVHEQILVVSGSEMFHRAPLRRLPRHRLGKAIDSFLDLREGDLVVHLAHGIGRYRGLQLLEQRRPRRGASGDRVPRRDEDLRAGVQDRAGAEVRGRHARRGHDWPRSAARTGCGRSRRPQTAVEDLAAEMLQMQAEREARPGIAFGADTDWQQEFDASFPYHETADQLTAIDAIKSDMADATPDGPPALRRRRLRQDRSGHAGRLQGRRQRLSGGRAGSHDDPGRAALSHLSRADGGVPVRRSPSSAASARPKNNARPSSSWPAGNVDIVIGTHRLASHDVRFHNLGL